MKRALSLIVLVLLAGCTQYALVEPKKTTVQSVLVVEPGIAWNRSTGLAPAAQTGEQGLAAEVWTVDGPLLHGLTFFVNVGDGQALIKPRPGVTDKLPIFKSAMTPTDVAELVESTIVSLGSSAIIKTRDLRSAKLGDRDGFRFELSYVLKDEVEREATAVAVIKDAKLFLILYQGTRLYHYGKYMPEVERIIQSAQFL